MLTSVRGLLAAAALSGGAFLATPALAQEEEADPAITVTGNVALVTDYRFRGIGLSGGDVAIQGGITLNHESGFYVGTWASSLEDSPLYGEVEMDLFGGYTTSVSSGVAIDVGVLYYAYPSKDAGAGPSEVWEFYGKVKPTIGPVGLTLGVAYSPDQDSLGGGDNLYLSADAGVGLPGTPISLSAHLGYTDGALSPEVLTGAGTGGGLDWSLGASATILGGLGLGVSYVGVDGASIDGISDDTVVGTLSFTF